MINIYITGEESTYVGLASVEKCRWSYVGKLSYKKERITCASTPLIPYYLFIYLSTIFFGGEHICGVS
jgi:hypothetical protein